MRTKAAKARRAGRPVDQDKRAAILAAAQRLFLSNGFEGTSMDAIAAAAGVSKLTAYNNFGSKPALFAQAVAAKSETAFAGIDPTDDGRSAVRDFLIGFGNAFLSLVLSPDAMAAHRLIGAERERAPELGKLFYENAVRPVIGKLATIIARREAAGEIRTGGDPVTAAHDLLALWRGRPFMMIELAGEAMRSDELTAHVARCTDICLAAWSPSDLRMIASSGLDCTSG